MGTRDASELLPGTHDLLILKTLVASRQPFQDGKGTIRAAVIHKDDFVGQAKGIQRVAHLLMQPPQVLPLAHDCTLLGAHLHPAFSISVEPLTIFRRKLTGMFAPEVELALAAWPFAHAGCSLRNLSADHAGAENSERNCRA